MSRTATTTLTLALAGLACLALLACGSKSLQSTGPGPVTCPDRDGDGYGSPGNSTCRNGAATDCNDLIFSISPGALEDCFNGSDDDCDGFADSADAECGPAPCSDLDGDGYGLPGNPACANGGARDCNDADVTTNPGAAENCSNGKDDDCDGLADGADSDCAGAGCTDVDGDGYGSPGNAACANGAALDCNDLDATSNPGAAENCSNGKDDDCDGLIDGADSDCAGCTDVDGDGYGSPGNAACANGAALDCDDLDATSNPGAAENCSSGKDDDCDGLIDGADSDCGTPSRAGEYQMTHSVVANGCGIGDPDNFWGTRFEIDDNAVQDYGVPGTCFGQVAPPNTSWNGLVWTYMETLDPMDRGAGCFATVTFEQTIDFTDPDALTGMDTVTESYSGTCAATPDCMTTWTIVGQSCVGCAPCP